MKQKKYHVRLTEAEKKRLLEITKKGTHPARQIIWANILLQLDESDPDKVSASARRTRQDWAGEVKSIVTEQYSRAEKAVLAMDNLHSPYTFIAL
jgi:hypothetical protein